MFNKIATLLKEKKMTFSDLARATGISESVFSNMKKRGGKLSIENTAKVAAALMVRIEELL